MKGVFWLIPCVLALLVPGCDTSLRDYRFPAQRYAKTLELRDQAVGTLYGRILFPSEYAQRSVTFMVDDRPFVTQPDGRYLVERVPAGARQLRISLRGYETVQRTVRVTPGPVTPGVLRLRTARGKVYGRLVSEEGLSARNVAVRLAPMGDNVETDNDGIFHFVGVNSGAHVLRVTDDQFFTYNREFNITPGEGRNLGNIQVFRRAGVAASRTAVLRRGKTVSPAVSTPPE